MVESEMEPKCRYQSGRRTKFRFSVDLDDSYSRINNQHLWVPNCLGLSNITEIGAEDPIPCARLSCVRRLEMKFFQNFTDNRSKPGLAKIIQRYLFTIALILYLVS